MSQKKKDPERVPFYKYLSSGTVGGIALVLVGQPMDTIKVRMQTSSKGQQMFKGPWDCVLQTVKKEGPLALYKGVISPMIGSAALFALCFASYGFGKKIVAKTDDASKMTAPQIFLAGLFAGTLPTLVMTPMERIKVLLQVQYTAKGGKQKYNGVFDCAKKIGLRGMYQGTMSTLYRDVPGSGFYYAGYELVLRALCTKGRQRKDLGLGHFIFAGGMAGIIGWCYMIFPDTIKSRIQAAEPGTYKNFMHATRSAIKSEGIGIFFKGLGPIFIRSFPANAACFAAYEYTMKLLNKMTEKKSDV